MRDEPLVIGPRARRVLDRATPAVLPVAVLLGTFVTAMGTPAAPRLLGPLHLASTRGFVVTAAVAVASAVAVWMVPRRRWPLFVLAVAAWLTLAIWPALSVASYVVATTVGRRSALLAYAASAAALLALPDLVAGSPPPAWWGLPRTLGSTATLVGLPMVIGLWVNARRQVRAERATQLAREQAARADQARAQERSRIAREMHDVVAHRVSLMVIHAGALEVSAPDERTAAEAALIRETGREALAQLRDVLGVLRSPHDVRLEPQPALRDLDQLLATSQAAGLPVSRREEGTVRPLPALVEHTAYRVVQEALTNVHKHAGPALTEVVLRYQPDALEVTVRNAPPDAPAGGGVPGARMGLVGLRERVELLDGDLTATPVPDGGFRVVARLPEHRRNGEERP